jgi:tetratricopeptide (TPR) repeat protein
MERIQRRAARKIQESGVSSETEVEQVLKGIDLDDDVPDATTDPREAAQALAYEAMDARGRRRRSLARQALDLWPECVDALSVLADDETDLESAIVAFERAVAAGEKELGPDFFAHNKGHFWGLIETRPYMRARMSLAQCLWLDGRHDEAIAHYRQLIELNPDDNQGVRTMLTPALIEIGELEAAEELLMRYKETYSAAWHYTWALLTFLRHGRGQLASRRLTEAFKFNPHLPDLLLERTPHPDEPPLYYKPKEPSEANTAFFSINRTWKKHPEAIDWLTQRWDRHTRS